MTIFTRLIIAGTFILIAFITYNVFLKKSERVQQIIKYQEGRDITRANTAEGFLKGKKKKSRGK